MNSILFVDDHPLYREGIQRTLMEALPGLKVQVADALDSALVALRAEPEIDLCLADYRLRGDDGLNLLQQVGSEFPTVARGLLCGSLTPELVERARSIGCVACLSKDRDAEELTEALNLLFEGGTVFDTCSPNGAERSVSAKRLEILRLAAAGMTNKFIAQKLGVGERTVKDHWAHLFEQLGVGTRAEAVGVAYRRNLL